MSVTTESWISTKAAMALTGLTFRQLDHLCRTVPAVAKAWDQSEPGSGHHRLWPPWLIERVQAAKALADAVPATAQGVASPKHFMGDVMRGPEPGPFDVYVIWEDGRVRYSGPPATTTGGVIARWR